MKPERSADIAIRVVQFLAKMKGRIEQSGGVERKEPLSLALYIVFLTVQTAILNGKVLEFADHCMAFTAKQAGREVSSLTLHAPVEPSAN